MAGWAWSGLAVEAGTQLLGQHRDARFLQDIQVRGRDVMHLDPARDQFAPSQVRVVAIQRPGRSAKQSQRAGVRLGTVIGAGEGIHVFDRSDTLRNWPSQGVKQAVDAANGLGFHAAMERSECILAGSFSRVRRHGARDAVRANVAIHLLHVGPFDRVEHAQEPDVAPWAISC